MESSFSEVTSSSITQSDKYFYVDESALSPTPTNIEQPTSKKDEPQQKWCQLRPYISPEFKKKNFLQIIIFYSFRRVSVRVDCKYSL